MISWKEIKIDENSPLIKKEYSDIPPKIINGNGLIGCTCDNGETQVLGGKNIPCPYCNSTKFK